MNDKLTEQLLLKAIADLEEMVKVERNDQYGHDEDDKPEDEPKEYNRMKKWRRIDVEKSKRKRLIRVNPEGG